MAAPRYSRPYARTAILNDAAAWHGAAIGDFLLWALPTLIFIVGAIDLVLTVHALESGWLDELNPITNMVIQNSGAAGLVAFRLASSSLGAALLYWALRTYMIHGGTHPSSDRIERVVRGGVGVLIASHVGLLLWWIVTLSA
jgi:hypothetical protein